MRIRNIVIAAAVLAVAVPSFAGAAPRGKTSGFKVTGGGQIVASETMQGAGDTVGFNAMELIEEGDDQAARGQFQYVPRGAGNPDAQEKFHGVVTCLITGHEAQANEAAEGDGNDEEALMPGMARFGGHFRDDPDRYFTVDVNDMGQGANATGSDQILVRFTEEPCADNPEDENEEATELFMLGRGNVKIHNYDSAGQPRR